MLDIPQITWRDLPGYKFGKPLDAAMLSDDGYIAPQRSKANQYSEAAYRNVIYDREYLLEVLVRKIIKPLSYAGKETIDDLIDEAWERFSSKNSFSSPDELN